MEIHKREMILEGAIRRFSHFSIHKTTMNEIAEDLSISKPNLYYYFPDKPSLVLAVAEKITEEYLNAIKDAFQSALYISESLLDQIRIRSSFFQKYYMLHISDGQTEALLKDKVLNDLMLTVKSKEYTLVAIQLKKGVEQGVFKAIDVDKTAVLFREMLTGLQLCMMAYRTPVPSSEIFNESLQKQLDVASIFLDGIRRRD